MPYKDKEKEREWYEKNREHLKKYKREYWKNNKERLKEKNKIYLKNNKESIKENKEGYYQKHQGKFLKKAKENYKKNRDQKIKYSKEYYKNNKEKFKERDLKYRQRPEIKKKKKKYLKKYLKNNRNKINQYIQNKRRTNKNYSIRVRLRTLFGGALKKYTKTGKIISASKYGINYQEIIEHLQPFPEDISLYHIDHIRPLSSFNFVNKDGSQNLEEIKIAFSPQNHQWLTIQENLVKGGRY